MSNQNKIAPINLVKASAWAAHHEYMKEMKRKPKERKTDKSEHINRRQANNGQGISD